METPCPQTNPPTNPTPDSPRACAGSTPELYHRTPDLAAFLIPPPELKPKSQIIMEAFSQAPAFHPGCTPTCSLPIPHTGSALHLPPSLNPQGHLLQEALNNRSISPLLALSARFYLPAGALLGQGLSYLSDWISSVSPQARALVLVEAWEASWASDFPPISASGRIHSLPQICSFCLRVLHGCMRELQPLSPQLESRGPATPTHSWLSHRINTTF